MIILKQRTESGECQTEGISAAEMEFIQIYTEFITTKGKHGV